jgi:outer membrane protein OmpA-like peptidoglycan-associated protein
MLKKFAIISLVPLLAASVAWSQVKAPSSLLKKTADVKTEDVKKSTGSTADADLKLLTKKLKSVQNEKGPIVFKVGSADLDTARCEKTLKAVADIVKAFPGFLVQIDGHTDNAGKPAANKTLSQKRAEAVRAYLVAHYDVPADRLAAKGFGDTQPIADNKSAEGKAKNRRVDFTVTRK